MERKDNKKMNSFPKVVLLSFSALIVIGGLFFLFRVNWKKSHVDRIDTIVEYNNTVEGFDEDVNSEYKSPQKNIHSDVVCADEEISLFARAKTLEEAEEIADKYGITLKSFAYGVAVFATDKDLNELIQYGRDMGLPKLSVDHEKKIMD